MWPLRHAAEAVCTRLSPEQLAPNETSRISVSTVKGATLFQTVLGLVKPSWIPSASKRRSILCLSGGLMTILREELFATDEVVEVLDEVDKRAFLPESGPSRLGRAFANPTKTSMGRKRSASTQQHRAENTQRENTRVLPCSSLTSTFSQGETKAYVPLGSYVRRVKTARAA